QQPVVICLEPPDVVEPIVEPKVPEPKVPTPAPGVRTYTIQAGDTFFRLAQRFGTTVAALQAANPGVDPNRLQIGQVINIPG
ncbi:MAG: LysM domain-containing protein, partial [Clostridia bacterium]|nr:LysM domain-containing protein [Clostridia bacterium]